MARLLGEILVAKQSITSDDVEQILSIQRQSQAVSRPYFGEICVSGGFCSETEVLQALSEQLSLPLLTDFIEKQLLGIQPESELALQFFSEQWWGNHQAFPIHLDGENIYVAQLNIWDEFVSQALQQKYNLALIPILCTNYELRQLLSEFEENISQSSGSVVDSDSASAPVVKFVNEAIQRAIKEQASDIHFEVSRNKFFVRYRVDGVLRTVDQPSMSQHSAILSRIKLMAGLDISEKRLPQDGRIRVRLSGQQIDIRVATTPTVFGENAVLRLLINEQQEKTNEDIKELAMLPDHLVMLRKILTTKNGIFLVTGPTGSGKTTSLYTILGRLNDEKTKIITVEDPVEYQMKGLTQIQVNSEIGLDFATVLRSALRQDPDIMLIGEMRDKETAQIAIQSALTGHFVLSTLHTNDAPSSFVRLKDIGIADYLIKSTVVGVMAQRLVRRLCPHCCRPAHGHEHLLSSLQWDEVARRWSDIVPQQVTWKDAVGCDKCNNTGYQGRLAIFELMNWSSEYDVPLEVSYLNDITSKQNMRTLRQDALIRAARGETTLEEVMRVVG